MINPKRLDARAVLAVSNMAAVAAGGGPIAETIAEFLQHLRAVFPFDAAQVSGLRPDADALRTITSAGYSSSTAEYLTSDAWHAEAVVPYGLPRTGWPVRNRDLSIDPMTLRGIAEYMRPDGLHEGILSALVSASGAHVGFLIASWTSRQPPPDDVCAVIGLVSGALAALVDPRRSARTLASALGEDHVAIAVTPGGRAMTIQGAPAPELMASEPPGRSLVDWVVGQQRPPRVFLWPLDRRGWYTCRVFECHDGMLLLSVRPLQNSYELTTRELEVLTDLAEGRSNAEIAGHLYITVRTVRAHVEHIMQKLQVNSRTAAVRIALADGLLVPRHGAVSAVLAGD